MYRARSVFAVVRDVGETMVRLCVSRRCRNGARPMRIGPTAADPIMPDDIETNNYNVILWQAQVGLTDYSPRIYNFSLRHFPYTMTMTMMNLFYAAAACGRPSRFRRIKFSRAYRHCGIRYHHHQPPSPPPPPPPPPLSSAPSPPPQSAGQCSDRACRIPPPYGHRNLGIRAFGQSLGRFHLLCNRSNDRIFALNNIIYLPIHNKYKTRKTAVAFYNILGKLHIVYRVVCAHIYYYYVY